MKKQRRAHGSAAEFQLSLLVLFALMAFPAINLIFLGAAYSATWFISFQSAMAAAQQTDFNSAIKSVSEQTSRFNSGGLTKCLKMVPDGGYQQNGTDIFIDAVNFIDSSKTQTIGPNKAVPPPIDLTNNIYEVVARTNYRVEPFVNLAAVPALGSVPGLGKPVSFSASVKRCAEFPQGLTRGSGNSVNGGRASTTDPATTSFASPVSLPPQATGEPWNRPKIYEEISSSGQQIVDHAVVLVNADNPDWTDTGIVVHPGQTIWIDFRADGIWGGSKGSYPPEFDADGFNYYGFGSMRKEGQLNMFNYMSPPISWNLVGAVDPPKSLIVAELYQFNVGKTKYKYMPDRTGALKIGNFDLFSTLADSHAEKVTDTNKEELVRKYYASHGVGTMTVRIVVSE